MDWLLPALEALAAQPVIGYLAGGAPATEPTAIAALALVAGGRRALVVQRTGWGKSAVYFVASLLLRARGAGPTLIVSPLLALMRNQIAAAERLGISALTINSTNREEWDEVRDLLADDAVDLLLISPERLNNPRFRQDMLPVFASPPPPPPPPADAEDSDETKLDRLEPKSEECSSSSRVTRSAS